jgi:hypothetical protein
MDENHISKEVTQSRSSESLRLVPLIVHLLIVVAVVLCVVVGFSLAHSDSIRLNYNFGFRTNNSLVSVSAWNAAQKVGFSWLFWCSCPVLILSAALALIGWFRKWSFIVLATLYSITWPVFLVTVLIASRQSDSAARDAVIGAIING